MNITQITDFIGFTNAKFRDELPPEREPEIKRDLGPKEVYLAWEAEVSKKSSKIDPKFKRTFLIIGVVIALLLVLMQEFLLILVIVSMFFISHALSTMSPQKFTYEVSSHGIVINGAYYGWGEFSRFFFSSHFGGELLALDLKQGMPSRLFVTFHAKDKKKLTEVLGMYLPHLVEEPVNFMDKAYTSFLDKFDFERKKS